MVKTIQAARGNSLPTHDLHFRLAVWEFLYASSHRQDSTHHCLVIPVVKHLLYREIAQWVHHEGLIRRAITPREDALPLSYTSLSNRYTDAYNGLSYISSALLAGSRDSRYHLKMVLKYIFTRLICVRYGFK